MIHSNGSNAAQDGLRLSVGHLGDICERQMGFANLILWLIILQVMVDYPSMIHRHLTEPLRQALSDTPVVLVNGVRQTGKSTLVESPELVGVGRQYLTFDDPGVLAAAQRDPNGFIAGLASPVTLDEVQHVPGLFPAIKVAVDRKREPGRFLLTGSANVLLLPKLSESLAGRMEVLTLWPFSQGETGGVREGFLDALFSKKPVWPAANAGTCAGVNCWRKCWPAVIHRWPLVPPPRDAKLGFNPNSEVDRRFWGAGSPRFQM